MLASAATRTEEFLATNGAFRLGVLGTEQSHPRTVGLSDMAKFDLPAGIAALKDVDMEMLSLAIKQDTAIKKMMDDIWDTLRTGGEVHLYGCGATGRLAIVLGMLARYQAPMYGEQIKSYMSGGDKAFVSSHEGFEDRPDWGARQVVDNGFGHNDLMIAFTEGGETPSVLGAVRQATQMSNRQQHCVFCNETELLRQHVVRSRDMIENPQINAIELCTGPQALSGSTRMQASTILTLIGGAAMMRHKTADIRRLQEFMQKIDLNFLIPFIEKEAEIYNRGGYVQYTTRHWDEAPSYAATIFTDMTERGPTFSQSPVENQYDEPRVYARAGFSFSDIYDDKEAWETILGREVDSIEWDGFQDKLGFHYISGYDFSAWGFHDRVNVLGEDNIEEFKIYREDGHMCFCFGGLEHKIDVSSLDPLFEQAFLKMVLNIHSTLVFGRLGCYESNEMTGFTPTNNKLYDRAIRQAARLLEGKVPYEVLAACLFETLEKFPATDRIVARVRDSFLSGPKAP